MEKSLKIFQQTVWLLLLVKLSSCNCPDRVEPTLDFSITPREPKFGDTVEFTDLSNASKVFMFIRADSISPLSSEKTSVIYYKQDESLGKIGSDSIFSESSLIWNYPNKGGNYNYDLTNRFRTRFVINKKVSKLIVYRVASNDANCSGAPFQTVDNSPIKVRKYDTIYVKAN